MFLLCRLFIIYYFYNVRKMFITEYFSKTFSLLIFLVCLPLSGAKMPFKIKLDVLSNVLCFGKINNERKRQRIGLCTNHLNYAALHRAYIFSKEFSRQMEVCVCVKYSQKQHQITCGSVFTMHTQYLYTIA